MKATNGIRIAWLTVALACSACSADLPYSGETDGTASAGASIPPGSLRPDSSQAAQADGARALPGPAAVAARPAVQAVGAPSPKQARPGPEASTTGCARCVITAFKSPIVTLFMSEGGQDGQRVPKSTLPVPVVATASDASRSRLEIMTLDGPRWVAAADVVIDRTP